MFRESCCRAAKSKPADSMLNVEEFVCPELRLAMCHVKEAMRTVLHSLVVCRSIGGHRPIDPKATVSEVFDLTFFRTDEPGFDEEIEEAARQFTELFEVSAACRCGKAQLVLSFFTTKTRKQTLWNLLVGSDEKVVFEQWRFPVVVQQLRRYPNTADNISEEASLQAAAALQVQQVLHFVVNRASVKVDHLPPPPQTQASYKFEVSFATENGKALGVSSTLLPPGFGSSLSQSIKHIPYIA